jgi:glucokinase
VTVSLRPARAAGAIGVRAFALVFDVGGTSIRAGLVDLAENTLVERLARGSGVVRRRPGVRWNAFVQTLRELGRTLRPHGEPAAIVVGFPGPVTSDGVALAAPTLWPAAPVEPFPLRAALEELWPSAVVDVVNDVTAAGFAYLDARRRSFCIVTVSSGIGHKVFLDGVPAVGSHGCGGELGHVVVDTTSNAPVCDCGGRGHLGAVASGRGTLRAAQARARTARAAFAASGLGRATDGEPARITNALLARSFRAGDAWTMNVVRPGAARLGWALSMVQSVVGIEDFLVVGGFATSLGERYLQEIAAGAERASWQSPLLWTRRLELGALGDDAGLIGAARHASMLVAER